MARVELKGLRKEYDGAVAVEGLDLNVKDKEFVVLLGPSGCGKTTTLRCIAGLEDVDDGEIHIGDRLVNDMSPRDRNIAMVFQSYALYPHMSVYQNMAFPLENAKVAEREIVERVNRTARLLQIEGLLSRKPAQLSGGQRQRVALGRAIVREPTVFLMDEPLSNLDAQLRVHMRAELKRLQKDIGVTTIYVTHDQVEAMTMGDRVAVMRKGELQQVAAPQELYDRPVNLFVGGFIGSPAMNMVEAMTMADRVALMSKGVLQQYDGPRTIYDRPSNEFVAGFIGSPPINLVPCDLQDGGTLDAGEFQIPVPNQFAGPLKRTACERVLLGIRPQDLTVSAGDSSGTEGEVLQRFPSSSVPAEIYTTEPLGDATILDLKVGAMLLKALVGATFEGDAGTQVVIRFPPERIHLFDRTSGRAIE